MHYRFAVASSIVRTLLAFVFIVSAIATFHCTIDHIPHIYCNADGDCDQAPYGTCDTTHHTCIDADGGIPNGDMPELAGPDMFCASSAACSDEAPICSVQRCRACMDSGDDAQCMAHNPMTPRCNAPTGRCVECLVSADCKGATPVCNTTAFTCRKCAANSECTSGVCKSDGSCADAGEVAYVNNASGACMDAVHASTPAMPYCQIQYAASNSAKTYILASGSATTYNALSFNATTSAIGPLTIIGPAGRGAATKARVSSSITSAAVAVTAATAAVTLTLDGLDIVGPGGAMAAPGVSCTGMIGATATLTIKNSTIDMSGKEGVNSSTCTLTLDGNLIYGNTNEGVKLSGTTYVITNNIINSNGGVTGGLPGVSITDSASTGTFAFNTVAANGGANALEGGVVCPPNGTVKLLQNSIVTQNAHNPMANGTQFVGKCMLQNVVTGQDTFTGATQSTPVFVSATDFHLDVGSGLTANKACCIDAIPSSTLLNSDHDVDRGPRPKVTGGAWDIGAHEAQ